MSKFYDIDLPFGEVYERKLKYILANKKIEVKTERDIWKTTGNICIELEYKNNGSGLNTTKADYWCHILQDNGDIKFMLLFPVKELRDVVHRLIKSGEARVTYGGDNNESLVALLPLKILVGEI